MIKIAGITHIKELKPEALGALAREVDRAALETQDDLLGFLPDEQIYDVEFAANIVKTTSQMGAMIGFGAEPPIRDRDQVAKHMGEVAKFGWKDIITENELLKLHNPRNDQEFNALVDAISTNGAKMVKETRDRINVSKLQAIGTGMVSYNDNNVKLELDFTKYIPDEHKVVLTGDNTWANPDHDVIGDLIDWNNQYEETNGKKADAIYLTRKVQALLLKNAVIVNEATGSNSGRTRVNNDELNSVLGSYGLPAVRLVKKTSAQVKNALTGAMETIELFPENRVVFVSSGVGTFKLGPTVENNFQPGIVLQAKDKDEPIQSILRTAASGFPVIENPGLLLYADVLEA
ncbi:major capsid protein [Oceanobacillus sojae]|uniref:major capsid protein n=1 Tax=Oceanobacillus sojae TaxID=582851 RepID=UPI0036261D06